MKDGFRFAAFISDLTEFETDDGDTALGVEMTVIKAPPGTSNESIIAYAHRIAPRKSVGCASVFAACVFLGLLFKQVC